MRCFLYGLVPLTFVAVSPSLANEVPLIEKCSACAAGDFSSEDGQNDVAGCFGKTTFGANDPDKLQELRNRYLNLNWDGDQSDEQNDVFPEDKIQGFLFAYFGQRAIKASAQSAAWKAKTLCTMLYDDMSGAIDAVEAADGQ